VFELLILETGQVSGRRILIYLSGIFTIDELRKGELG
jgi:hypothetical protein